MTETNYSKPMLWLTKIIADAPQPLKIVHTKKEDKKQVFDCLNKSARNMSAKAGGQKLEGFTENYKRLLSASSTIIKQTYNGIRDMHSIVAVVDDKGEMQAICVSSERKKSVCLENRLSHFISSESTRWNQKAQCRGSPNCLDSGCHRTRFKKPKVKS